MKKQNFTAFFLMAIAPFVMSMTCTHTPPNNPPSVDAAVVDASHAPTTDGSVDAVTETCGIPTSIVDDVSNTTFNALQDAQNSQSRLNTLASQYTTASITCLVNKIVAGTPNAPQTVTRANTWLRSTSAKKAHAKK